MEQPEARHSKPAAVKILSRPSASAWALTCMEPGTQIARSPGATRRPRNTAAASRRSLIRLLVQEPIKAASMAMPCSGRPASRPM